MPIVLMLALAAATPAAPDPDLADGQCAAIFAALGNSVPAAQKANTAAGLLYFIGKMKGRHPDADIGAVIDRGGRSIGDDAAVRRRCVGEFGQIGQQMVTAGNKYLHH